MSKDTSAITLIDKEENIHYHPYINDAFRNLLTKPSNLIINILPIDVQVNNLIKILYTVGFLTAEALWHMVYTFGTRAIDSKPFFQDSEEVFAILYHALYYTGKLGSKTGFNVENLLNSGLKDISDEDLSNIFSYNTGLSCHPKFNKLSFYESNKLILEHLIVCLTQQLFIKTPGQHLADVLLEHQRAPPNICYSDRFKEFAGYFDAVGFTSAVLPTSIHYPYINISGSSLQWMRSSIEFLNEILGNLDIMIAQ